MVGQSDWLPMQIPTAQGLEDGDDEGMVIVP
jgi:hypothetical protein